MVCLGHQCFGKFGYTNSGTIELESRAGKWFGEDVGQLIKGCHRDHFEIFDLSLAANEVVFKFNVLGAVVKFRVVDKADCTVVVAVDRSRSGLPKSKLLQDVTEPSVVAASVSSSVVFGLSC